MNKQLKIFHRPGLILFALLSLQGLKAQDYLQQVGKTDSIFSKTLNEQRIFYVQLPASYQNDTNQEYPLVIVLDGEQLLPTVHNVQTFYSGGFSPEMVLVGVSNESNRNRDLTPSKVDMLYGMPAGETGGAEQFSTFLRNELIPYLERNYRLTKYRSLIGHSYGGLFTIYSLLEQPDLFANYMAIDPSLDWDDQYLVKIAKEKLYSADLSNKSLFMTLGGQLHMQNPEITLDNVMQDNTDFTLFARSNIEFSQMIQANPRSELDYSWKFYPNDLHGTIAFPSIHEGLISLFSWYQMEQTDKFNSPETSVEELREIIEYRANKLKNHFGYDYPPYPEELLNVLGYMSMDMEQPKKAKMYFESCIKYYPKSANALDSFAEFHEGQGDYETALKLITKAYEISKSEYHLQRKGAIQEKLSGK